MLKHLSISNYALIEKLNLDFSEGLTIITGETGAGKSILLGALSLILGNRADAQVIQDRSGKCIIEGNFNIEGYQFEDFFTQHNLDYDSHTLLRREINNAGKSRAFINDTPVSLNVLKELGTKLIDVHSQHQTLTLNDAEFQMNVLDNYAQNRDVVSQYQLSFQKYKLLQKQLHELISNEHKSKADLDYFQFLFDELNEASLKENELPLIEQELEELTHAEEIKLNLTKAAFTLSEGENNILLQLSEIKSRIALNAKYSYDYKDLLTRVNSMLIELKDIAFELNQKENNIIYSTDRIEELNIRIDTVNRLLRKHNCTNETELLQLQNSLEEKLGSILNLDSKISELNNQLIKQEVELDVIAVKLSSSRKKAIVGIEKEVKKLLIDLGMPNAILKISLTQSADFELKGKDKVQFLFSANKGSDPKELSKVISGGELSRLMLSIKSLISQRNLLPTIIFDEIDTGVSGAIADKVGDIMKTMSLAMQVVAITHLPQIASKGKSHYFVYKETEGKTTKTAVKQLRKNERINEIARMLSGKDLTDAALRNAKTLMKEN